MNGSWCVALALFAGLWTTIENRLLAQATRPTSPTDRLLLELRNLDQRLQAEDDTLRRTRQRIDELKVRLEQLRAVPPPPSSPEPSTPLPTRIVEYRPPQLRVSQKDTELAVVCRDKRVYLFDLTAMSKALAGATINTTGLKVLADGDFDVNIKRWDIVGSRGNQIIFAPQSEAVLKPGTRGESVAEIQLAASRFQRRLEQLDPSRSALQFMVFPDSYDVFRDARAAAWKRNFSLGWIPRETGSVIGVGGGGRGVGVQNAP